MMSSVENVRTTVEERAFRPAPRIKNNAGFSPRFTKYWRRTSGGAVSYFVSGNPFSRQTRMPPSIESTFLYPIFCKLSAASTER